MQSKPQKIMIRLSIIALLLALSTGIMAQNSGKTFRDKFEKAVFTDSTGTQLPFRLLRPDSRAQANQKFPVVLFLHGAGERGYDNEANLTYIDKVFGSDEFMLNHPCYVIVPQCDENYRWCETDWTLAYHTMPQRMSKYLSAANELLDSVASLSDADINRLYVTGMSMGGFGTWDIITRYPNKFAAAMPICGGADEKQACRLKNIPIRTFHGGIDKLVKVSRSRNITNAIKACGGNKITYTEFPSMGHLIWEKVYTDPQNLDWLFSNTKK